MYGFIEDIFQRCYWDLPHFMNYMVMICTVHTIHLYLCWSAWTNVTIKNDFKFKKNFIAPKRLCMHLNNIVHRDYGMRFHNT